MSEEIKGDSVAPEADAGGNVQEVTQENPVSGGNDTVKYDTYKRTLSEAKKYKSEVDDLRSKLVELEQNQMSAEGKKDELIESLKRQNGELDGKLKSAVGNFAKSRVQEVMISEASKLGCQDPELLIKAYGNDIEDINFDDSFNPDRDQVASLVNKWKTEKSFLFNKSAPSIASHNLKPEGSVSQTESKDVSKMDTDKLMAIWEAAEAQSK